MPLVFLEKYLNIIISEEIWQSRNLDQLRGHIGAHAVVEPSTGKNDLRVVANGFGFVGQVVRVHASSLISALFEFCSGQTLMIKTPCPA